MGISCPIVVTEPMLEEPMDPTITQALDRIARTQHGLVTTQQAADILGPNRRRRWIEDGRLLRVQPRVLRLHGSPRSDHQAMQAASLSADGPVSHRSAGWVWSIADRSDVVDVSIRYPRAVQLLEPAVAHRIRDLSATCEVWRGGLRVTDPMRTIVDLGLVEPWPVVDAVLGRAIASKLLPLRAVVALREDLARRGRNGTGVVQRVFDERLLRGADEDSPLELVLLRVVRRFGLPPLTFQHEIWHEGRFVARVDGAYPDRLVAIEIDGYVAHAAPDAFQHDRTRQNALAILGWAVLRFTAQDLLRHPHHVAATIKSVL